MSTVKVNLLLECGGGGAGRHVLDLYHGLVARKWPVRLILSMERADRLFIEEVRQLPSLDVVLIDARRHPHPTDFFALRMLRHLANPAGGFSIVHAHSTKAGLLARGLRRHGIATLFTPHAFRGMEPELRGLKAQVVRQADRLIAQPFDRIIAVSRAEYDYARALGLPEDRLRHIPNGLDLDALVDRHGEQPRATIPPYRIGFIGRLVHQKHPEAFLRIFHALLRDGVPARALIVGEGPRLPVLQRMCSEWGITSAVEFRGAVKAVTSLADMDLLVHTSRYESLPYVLLEALAARVPVVAVTNAGSQEILAPDRLVSVVDDVPAFVRLTRRLLQDEVHRRQVINEGLRQLARFGVSEMTRSVEQEYIALRVGQPGFVGSTLPPGLDQTRAAA